MNNDNFETECKKFMGESFKQQMLELNSKLEDITNKTNTIMQQRRTYESELINYKSDIQYHESRMAQLNQNSNTKDNQLENIDANQIANKHILEAESQLNNMIKKEIYLFKEEEEEKNLDNLQQEWVKENEEMKLIEHEFKEVNELSDFWQGLVNNFELSLDKSYNLFKKETKQLNNN